MASFKTLTQVMMEPGVLLPPGATVELTEDQAAPLLASGCVETPEAAEATKAANAEVEAQAQADADVNAEIEAQSRTAAKAKK